MNLCKEKAGPLYEGGNFIDCGSGTGKQVLGASVLHPWTKCAGIELVGCLDAVAQGALGVLQGEQENFADG